MLGLFIAASLLVVFSLVWKGLKSPFLEYRYNYVVSFLFDRGNLLHIFRDVVLMQVGAGALHQLRTPSGIFFFR